MTTNLTPHPTLIVLSQPLRNTTFLLSCIVRGRNRPKTLPKTLFRSILKLTVLKELGGVTSHKQKMAKRSDFAQKLLDDLRLRKERMASSQTQRSNQSRQLQLPIGKANICTFYCQPPVHFASEMQCRMTPEI